MKYKYYQGNTDQNSPLCSVFPQFAVLITIIIIITMMILIMMIDGNLGLTNFDLTSAHFQLGCEIPEERIRKDT